MQKFVKFILFSLLVAQIAATPINTETEVRNNFTKRAIELPIVEELEQVELLREDEELWRKNNSMIVDEITEPYVQDEITTVESYIEEEFTTVRPIVVDEEFTTMESVIEEDLATVETYIEEELTTIKPEIRTEKVEEIELTTEKPYEVEDEVVFIERPYGEEEKLDEREDEELEIEGEENPITIAFKGIRKEIREEEELLEREEKEEKYYELKKSEDSVQRIIPVIDTDYAEELIPSTLCESSPEFKYFLPHPTEPTKYVQCDPWGTGIVEECPEGQIWDSWSLKCNTREQIKNLTYEWPIEKRPLFTVGCNGSETTCLNDGVCTLIGDEYKCVCVGDYSGDYCESKIESALTLYADIMSGNFSLEEYKQRIIDLNLTMDAAFYEKYEGVLEGRTYEELMKYLSFYKKNEVRYDTLITDLVQDLLQDIYPDAEYLTIFKASEQQVIEMVRLIPNLLSYARYSFNRYTVVFNQYQKVLDRLFVFLNTTDSRIKEEALLYTQLTNFFLNETIGMMNLNTTEFPESEQEVLENVDEKIESYEINHDELKLNIGNQYNATLEASIKLFDLLQEFQEFIGDELLKNPELFDKTLGEVDYPICKRIITIFDQISTASNQIWNTLVNYGFWYLTGALTVDGQF